MGYPSNKTLGVDSFSVIFNHFFQKLAAVAGFPQAFQKDPDPWKEWTWKVPLEHFVELGTGKCARREVLRTSVRGIFVRRSETAEGFAGNEQERQTMF